MPRPWPVHVIAVTALVGLMLFLFDVMGPALPGPTRLAVAIITLGYAGGSLALVVVRELWVPEGRGAKIINRIVNGTGGIIVVADFWLIAPHASEQLRFVMLVYQVGTVTIQVANAVQPPPSKPSGGLTVLVIPASIAAYYAVHWEPVSVALILFAAAYGVLAWTLRRLLQSAVDRAHDARLAAEAALAQAAAERDAKSRFLESASHDLGQPLQAARLFFDQTLRSPTDRERETAAARVAWAFDSMEQLLRRILDFLRLDAGAVTARIGPVAAGPLIARLAELNEPAARLAKLSIEAMPTRLAVLGDPELIERVLGNMVLNAIRHSKAGRVVVGARRRAGRVRLWVIDDGVGVPPADAARLFDDYVQGSDHGDEIRGGFGLGLASARRMAALMNGEVGLASKTRRGAAFWLELPAAPANSVP